MSLKHDTIDGIDEQAWERAMRRPIPDSAAGRVTRPVTPTRYDSPVTAYSQEQVNARRALLIAMLRAPLPAPQTVRPTAGQQHYAGRPTLKAHDTSAMDYFSFAVDNARTEYEQ